MVIIIENNNRVDDIEIGFALGLNFIFYFEINVDKR